MARASVGVRETSFSRIMRLSASCQPSGVARAQEIRCRFPCSSAAWHVPHFASTRGSVTGMPTSVWPCASKGTAEISRILAVCTRLGGLMDPRLRCMYGSVHPSLDFVQPIARRALIATRSRGPRQASGVAASNSRYLGDQELEGDSPTPTWALIPYGATQDREFSVRIETVGGASFRPLRS